MSSQHVRTINWLTISGLLLSLFIGAQAHAAARPTLANDGPKVQRGLKIGDNSVRSFVYNEQRSIPAPLKHRIRLPVYLIVTDPKGKETRYTARNPPEHLCGRQSAGQRIRALGQRQD